MACLNPKFADELQAINTIYSQNTLRVRRTLSDGRLEILFRLPAPLPQDQLTFHLLFPADYPDCDQSPQYLHADVGLYESQDRRLQNISLFVAICLEWVFVKGDVCVFDLVDVVLGFVGCLDVENNTENGGGQSKDRPGHGINVEKLEALGPRFSNCDWRWTRKSFINMNEARKQIECFICCDEDFAFRMIRTACQHWYCFDCFQMGWDVAVKGSEVYTCCNQRIPVDTIRSCTTATKEECDDYERELAMRDTVNPFLCGNPACNVIIGSFSLWDLSRGKVKSHGVFCPRCKLHTCSGCRMLVHPGVCIVQKELLALFRNRDIRRCPKCGEAIEKNGGCPHMQCRRCRSHFTWHQDGSLGQHHGPLYDLN